MTNKQAIFIIILSIILSCLFYINGYSVGKRRGFQEGVAAYHEKAMQILDKQL